MAHPADLSLRASSLCGAGRAIDELAAQAQSKTDKLVPQIKQAAALLNVSVSS